MSPPWRSSGQKRSVVWPHEPPLEVLRYLADTQDPLRYALQVAYGDAVKTGRIPSPIQLRREIREWFYSRYDYARYHVNPVRRTAVSMLTSFNRAK